MTEEKLTTISLFTGAMGLDIGLELAGFDVKLALECNKSAVETIRLNRPNLEIIDKKIEIVTTQKIVEAAAIGETGPILVSGGPSCQPFSTAGQRGSVNDPRGGLFREFIRVVQEMQPRFFVMENVHGILSAAVKHRPLNQRGPGFPLLEPTEELGSAFLLILEEFKELGYYVIFDLLNSADYGSPQARERMIFIGSRDGEPIAMPIPTHHRTGERGLPKWAPLRSAIDGLDEQSPQHKQFSTAIQGYLQQIPAGGNWRNLPADLQRAALGKAYESWGGRSGFMRRLSWDEPAPALTTDPAGRATMLCHPDETRPLSIGEYAAIQQFPSGWQFAGSLTQQYMQIGNAVPVGLGAAIGRALVFAMTGKASAELLGKVLCTNAVLLDRLAKRPKTMLNPPRMRAVKEQKAAKEWLKGGKRAEILAYGEQLTLKLETNATKCTIGGTPKGTNEHKTEGAQDRADIASSISLP